GFLHLKTDNTGFFDYSVEMLEQQNGSFLVQTRDLYNNPPEGFDLSIRTTYEKIFMDKGELIKYLRFQWS
ncbi:MAG: tRNA (guanosine(46)-N7)-methyltransferase TrmB, partial [Bacteroidota bacterium]